MNKESKTRILKCFWIWCHRFFISFSLCKLMSKWRELTLLLCTESLAVLLFLLNIILATLNILYLHLVDYSNCMKRISVDNEWKSSFLKKTAIIRIPCVNSASEKIYLHLNKTFTLSHYLHGVTYVTYVSLLLGYRCWFIELSVEVMLAVVLRDGEVAHSSERLMSRHAPRYV